MPKKRRGGGLLRAKAAKARGSIGHPTTGDFNPTTKLALGAMKSRRIRTKPAFSGTKLRKRRRRG